MGSIRTVARKGGEVSYVARIHRRGEEPQSKTFRDKASARKWSNATEAKIDKKENVSRTAETLRFSEVCAQFLQDYRAPKGDAPCSKGERTMVPILAAHFCTRDPDIKVSEITRSKIAGYIPALKKTPVPESKDKKKDHPLYKGGGGGGRTYSGNTARKYFFQLKKILMWASVHYDFVLDAKLFAKIGVPSAWENPRERRLEGDEEARLIAAGLRSIANGKQWRLIILFAIETAARTQEMLLAQWKEFNVPGEAWNIPKEHVKTKVARQVPLSTQAIALIEELREFRKKPKSPNEPLDKDELVFPFWADTSTLSKAFKRLTVRAKMDDFHFHDLRHEGVTRLFMTAMTDVEIMKMTGHTSAATLSRYSHNRASNVAAKINAKWSPDKFIEAKKPAAKSPARAKKAVPA
jgi:integrase